MLSQPTQETEQGETDRTPQPPFTLKVEPYLLAKKRVVPPTSSYLLQIFRNSPKGSFTETW